MVKARRIDHICIAVKDLDKARTTYEDVLGLELDILYVVEKEKIKGARYYLGDVALELLEPTSPDGEVAKFLERNGEGVFLISYRVDSVAEGLEELKSKGYRLIDETPSRTIFGQPYAFLTHPKETCGVLTEIAERPL